jgi:hypothetical protein
VTGKAHWGEAEVEEYDSIIEATLRNDVSTSERAETFAYEIESAIQAHRPWAREVEQDAKRRGYLSIYKQEVRKGTVLVQVGGEDIEKPAMVSVQRVGDNGVTFQQLAFYEVMTREQIAFKRTEYIKARRAYDSNVAVMDKLTAMLDAAEADDLATAAASLGLSVEEWLAGSPASERRTA